MPSFSQQSTDNLAYHRNQKKTCITADVRCCNVTPQNWPGASPLLLLLPPSTAFPTPPNTQETKPQGTYFLFFIPLVSARLALNLSSGAWITVR